MYNGFLKVGVVSPEIKVADTKFNAEKIKLEIINAENRGVEVLVFPELSLTGATCGDLFFSSVLTDGALSALLDIAKFTEGKKVLAFLSLPIKKDGNLYIASAPVQNGSVLAFAVKSVISPKLSRWFNSFSGLDYLNIKSGEEIDAIPFGSNIILSDENKNVKIFPSFFDDVISQKTAFSSLAGANVIISHSSTPALIGQDEYKRNILSATSKTGSFACILSDSSSKESTTDEVYGSGNLVYECGEKLLESKIFDGGLLVTDIDISFVESERKRNKIFDETVCSDYYFVGFSLSEEKSIIDRNYTKTPFVPAVGLNERAELILDIQSEGIRKRIEHTNAKSLVLGLSGGLDSTLAILVLVTALKKLDRPLKDIVAVTMPCFGTTSRTYQNTIKLAKACGATLKKVDITKSVLRHLKDIKHDISVMDATYENAQARERTQVLMDIANQTSGLVVGTGDLSELALGWATYNGDHMSMYGVNASIPKTLVRFVVECYKDKCKGKLKAVLEDILDTPVSPELLPPKDGDIAQKTEDIVGPYILHDFYLYHLIRRGSSPKKVLLIARKTFEGAFDNQTIEKWLKTFIRRFFSQQFKRSCVPDGVSVGTVALSPRGGFVMPSDATANLWISELDN